MPAAHDGNVVPVEKAPGAVRIVCIGESSMAGFPYEVHLRPSAMLQADLRARYPGRQIEVVNLGIAAISSYPMTEFVSEAMKIEPDLFLIYAGHNEFYGALGVASTEAVGAGRGPLVRAYLALRHVRTFNLLRAGLMNLRRGVAPDAAGRTLMSQMAQSQAIPLDSPLYRAGVELWRDNLTRMIHTAKSHGVPVIVGTIVANERDQPPLLSIESPDHAVPIYEADRIDPTGVAALLSGDGPATLSFFRSAVQARPGSALAHFRLGRALDLVGDTAAATAYHQARALDGLRFRATDSQVTRAVCRTENGPLVEVEAAFRRESPGGVVGDSLMLEHVHPTYSGYQLLARTFADGIVQMGLLGPPTGSPIPPSARDSTFGATTFDLLLAREKIAELHRDWPFAAGQSPPQPEPTDEPARTVYRYARRQLSLYEAKRGLAEWYTEHGRFAEADREYRSLEVIVPDAVGPKLGRVDVLIAAERGADAERMLDSLARTDNGSLVLVRRGLLRINRAAALRGSGAADSATAVYNRAAADLQRAVELNGPGAQALGRTAQAEASYNLAGALASVGRTAEAVAAAERARALDATLAPKIDALLGQLGAVPR